MISRQHTNRDKGISSFLAIAGIPLLLAFQGPIYQQREWQSDPDSVVIEVISGTFLGNTARNFYGTGAPSRLDVLWKCYLGKGMTTISRKIGKVEWAGAGWTGQPLLLSQNGELYLIQGAYDHHLRKIRAADGEVMWTCAFDDVIKGTGTIYMNDTATEREHRCIILQGSRLGTDNYLDTEYVPSYRAVSFLTGQELWRLDSKWTDSYSRDVDASALIIADTAYIGLENSLFTVFSPDPALARMKDSMLQPLIYREMELYTPEDVVKHRNNVVTEASPALLGNRIYISSGSGHVWGYNLDMDTLDWDFYIGSDMDGTPVVTDDSCIIVTVEKQYINGPGGVFKLNPLKEPPEAVVWYFPTGNTALAGWKGGVIGSAAVNDYYRKEGEQNMAVFSAIDGFLYIVNHKRLKADTTVMGPDNLTCYPTPELIFRYQIGPSISTPLFTDRHLVAAGYGGLHLFEYDSTGFRRLDRFVLSFESTPVIWNKCIYLASRDGFLYCFGEKKENP